MSITEEDDREFWGGEKEDHVPWDDFYEQQNSPSTAD